MSDATRSSRASRRSASTARAGSTKPTSSRRTPTSRGGSRTTSRTTSKSASKSASRATDRRRRPAQPAPARLTDRLRSRLALGGVAAVILAAIVATLVVLPVRTWLDQRHELDAKHDELTILERANEALADDITRLQTPEGIEAAARVELGYQMPGEIRVATNEAPRAPVDLPAGWPYSTIEQILAVRRGAG